MYKSSQKSSEQSSGFGELDDDTFDLDAPIRPNADCGEQVYSSQLSFAFKSLDKDQAGNFTVVSSDGDSGFTHSQPASSFGSGFTHSQPASSFGRSAFGTQTSPSASRTQLIIDHLEEIAAPIRKNHSVETTENGSLSSKGSLSHMDSEETISDTDGLLQFLSLLPLSILELYRGIHEHCSDYAFAYAIAGQMCHWSFPIDCFHSVKLALTLSLISTQCDEMTPIPIIAIGRDVGAMSSLMNGFRVYTQRFCTPFGDLKINRSHRDGAFIEANSLLMATNGVCFIGDWSTYQASCADYVKNVLETGRVIADAQSNMNFPLNCAVWSYWFCCTKKKSVENVMLFSNVFGIPVVLEENPTHSLIDKLLAASGVQDRSRDDGDHFHVDTNDVKNFLHFIGRRPVYFSDEAELLIKRYFTARRINRSTLLSQRALEMLRKMAECHAKLCLNDHVQRNDVVACIVLCEKFIFHVYGIEQTNAPFLGPVHSLIEVESYMKTFERWLNSNLEMFGRRSEIE